MDLLVKEGLYSSNGESLQIQIEDIIQELKEDGCLIKDIQLIPITYADLLRYTLVVKYEI